MQAHIVGGGFGGLAAAAYLIRNAGVSGQDITIYEADERMGGGFFLGGSAETGYNLPGSVFDNGIPLYIRLACRRSPPQAIRLFPSKTNSSHSIRSTRSTTGRTSSIATAASSHGPHFGLSVRDGLDLVRLALTPEATAGRAAHRGVLFPAVLLNRILVALVDNHGVAAAAQRDGVSALHEPRPGLVPGPVGHDAHPAHALQPIPGVYRTAGRLAASTRREIPGQRLRPGYRLRAVAWPHNCQPARLRTGGCGDIGRGRAGRCRAGDHSDRRPRTFRWDR